MYLEYLKLNHCCNFLFDGITLFFVTKTFVKFQRLFSIFWNWDSMHFCRCFLWPDVGQYLIPCLKLFLVHFILNRYRFAHLYLHFGSFLRSFETMYSATNTGSSALITDSFIHELLPYEAHVIFNIGVPCLFM